MTKRPDQYQIDPAEAGATDYKSLRQTEAGNRRSVPESPLEAGENQDPKQTMEARRKQSQADREKELERAAGVRDRGEGNHPASGDEPEPEVDRSNIRHTGAGRGSREQRDENLGTSGKHSHQQSSTPSQRRGGAEAGEDWSEGGEL